MSPVWKSAICAGAALLLAGCKSATTQVQYGTDGDIVALIESALSTNVYISGQVSYNVVSGQLAGGLAIVFERKAPAAVEAALARAGAICVKSKGPAIYVLTSYDRAKHADAVRQAAQAGARLYGLWPVGGGCRR